MPTKDPNDGRMLVRIRGSAEVVRTYLTEHPAECERIERSEGTIAVDVLVEAGRLGQLATLGLRSEVLFDAGRYSRELRRRVGTGNRFSDGRIPRGLGLAEKTLPR
jgi:hypothetical protein